MLQHLKYKGNNIIGGGGLSTTRLVCFSASHLNDNICAVVCCVCA